MLDPFPGEDPGPHYQLREKFVAAIREVAKLGRAILIWCEGFAPEKGYCNLTCRSAVAQVSFWSR